jgi:prepilin-type N-terminal cleavage/methylation domain-containing protein
MASRVLPRSTLRAFTLVELLVVIGVIAILLGLLLTGLRAAIGAGGKSRELSALRQVYYGWSMYATNSEERVLPGFLDENTQALWNVEYRDMARQDLDPDLTQAWPWRLAPYVDFSWEVLVGYRTDYDKELAAVPAADVQAEPAFGYNAVYTGGWWTSPNPSGPALPRFDRYVTRAAGSFSRPDSMILFAGSAARSPGFYKSNSDDQFPGSHWVSPPNQATTEIWRGDTEGPGSIEVLASNVSVPINRNGPAISVLTSDGGVQGSTMDDLFDMRRWVDAATSKEWTHPPE